MERIVNAEIPKNTVIVIKIPDIAIRRLISIPVALPTGIANIATPTPNQPTCVPPSKNEGSQEPLIPKE
ncbi:Uncharacterised protein [Proteus mirabilis]|uniref:Uncharacterized protein n=1 Tax=Proteus mirabilis TaxID=584 RepID=A0A2X2DUA5_PROMI|nr:Uncharacterised protein [Proteus mirabilis]